MSDIEALFKESALLRQQLARLEAENINLSTKNEELSQFSEEQGSEIKSMTETIDALKSFVSTSVSHEKSMGGMGSPGSNGSPLPSLNHKFGTSTESSSSSSSSSSLSSSSLRERERELVPLDQPIAMFEVGTYETRLAVWDERSQSFELRSVCACY